MISSSGYKVANQFIISNAEFGGQVGTAFQSYATVIAVRPAYGSSVTLDPDWRISTTTSKYRNQFLGETTKETQAKIKSGEYILADLN